MKTVLLYLLALPCILLGGYIRTTPSPVEKYLRPLEQFVHFSSGVIGVDCLYVINLNHRKERWERMQRILAQEKIRAHRYPAIWGATLSNESCKELFGPYEQRYSKNVVGCLLSHISVLKDAQARGFRLIWVMEDDTEFSQHKEALIPLMLRLSRLDPDWDILYTDPDSKAPDGSRFLSLGSDFRPGVPHIPMAHLLERTPVDTELERIHQRFGLYSYLVSKKGLDKIVHYFTHVFLWTPVDVDIHYIPGLREYALRRDFVTVHYEQNDHSDIR